MKTKKEQTGRQSSYFWPITGVSSWAWGQCSTLIKAVRGSGASEGKNDYDKPYEFYGAGAMGLGTGAGINNILLPWTLQRYRTMSAHPTLAIAEAATLLTILSAEWGVGICDDLADDKTAIKVKQILEADLLPRRQGILRGALQSCRYGSKSFEIVYLFKNDKSIGGYTGIGKVKQLAGEFISFNLDDKGNLIGVNAGGTTLDAPYFLHIVHDKEDDNWFGRSRHENVRRSWANSLHLEDLLMRLSRKASGKTPYVGVPADDPGDIAKNKRPNFQAGLTMARALDDGQATAYYRLPGIDDQDIKSNPALVGVSSTSIDFIDIGNPGPAIASISARLADLDKQMVRGWLKPERTLIEATMGGSRADSESHGDLSMADAEALHESIVEQINEQLVAALVRENAGEEYVGKITLTAIPIQDDRKAALSKFFDALMTDGAFRADLVRSLSGQGVDGVIQKLGLDVKIDVDKFDEQPEPVAPPAGKDVPAGDTQGDTKPDPENETGDDAGLSAIDTLDEILAL